MIKHEAKCHHAFLYSFDINISKQDLVKKLYAQLPISLPPFLREESLQNCNLSKAIQQERRKTSTVNLYNHFLTHIIQTIIEKQYKTDNPKHGQYEIEKAEYDVSPQIP
ncbi:MAG: hypothetical protein V2I33_25245 [Kangiellaceae bacterium]|jgi:hypothetical protein|nr:hypothetical protein [Kangiellaceae bacterium]